MEIRYIQILSMEIQIELNVSNFKERSQQKAENRFKPGSAQQRIDREDRKNKEQFDRGDEKLIKESTGASAANEVNTTYKNMNTFLVHKENSLENVSFVMHTYIYIYTHVYMVYIYILIYIFLFYTENKYI